MYARGVNVNLTPLTSNRGALATDAGGCSLWRSLLERPPPLGESRVQDPLGTRYKFGQCGPGRGCYIYIQWGKKVFSQPPIVQVLPLKKMREACNFHHRYTSTMRDKIRKINPENHIVGFLKNLFANYGGK